MNIIALAFDMSEAVEAFVQKARGFFYQVVLFRHRCPSCNGALHAVGEGRCRCGLCGRELDPTIAFQRCVRCGGAPVLRIRRYECQDCGSDIQSRFLFDGLAFDPEYFRQKMAESRQRRDEQRERVRQMLAESRSDVLPLGEADLDCVPGLVAALNALTIGLDEGIVVEARPVFDLHRYEAHIQAHLGGLPVSLTEIPPLCEHLRKDLIWRFIAVIFLAHAGVVDIWQDGQNIRVIEHEADRERCGISEPSATIDGVEGLVG
jgi:hypothetical protein